MEEVKTRSLRIDSETQSQINIIKERNFSDNDSNVSFSNLIRYCIDFTYNALGKEILTHEEVIRLSKGYAAIALSSINGNLNLQNELLCGIDEINSEYYPDEIKEIYELFNEEAPMTLGKLIRFENRSLPEFFLDKLGIGSEDYKPLSDVELVDFILERFKDDDFRRNARQIFNIDN